MFYLADCLERIHNSEVQSIHVCWECVISHVVPQGGFPMPVTNQDIVDQEVEDGELTETEAKSTQG